MTRQLVDENDENFSSTRYSQKPKRRLFFDSNEWEDARTNVEKEEENANIDSKESAAHRNRCLEQKLARAEALHSLSVQSKREKGKRVQLPSRRRSKSAKELQQGENIAEVSKC